jgi:hypothetical protein
MSNKDRKMIMPQMFDVRPVDASGGLDFSRIDRVAKSCKKDAEKIAALPKKAPRIAGVKSSICSNTCDIRSSQKTFSPDKSGSTRQADNILEFDPRKKASSRKIKREFPTGPRKMFRSGDIIFARKAEPMIPEERKEAKIFRFGEAFDTDKVPMVHQAERVEEKEKIQEENLPMLAQEAYPSQDDFSYRSGIDQERSYAALNEPEIIYREETASRKNILADKKELEPETEPIFSEEGMKDGADQLDFSIGDGLREKIVESLGKKERNLAESFFRMFTLANLRRPTYSFSGVALGIFIIVISLGFFNKGLKMRDAILGTGNEAYFNLALAKDGMMDKDFSKSSFEFGEAQSKFESISRDINGLAGILVPTSRYIPFLSKLSSGENMAQAGKNVSRIGILVGETMQAMDEVKNPLDNGGGSVSFLEIFKKTDKNLHEILELVSDTEERLDKVNVDDIPEEQRAQFVLLRSKLPEIKSFIESVIENDGIITDVLGGNGPRKYLFLFQNNQEMRATGGFIGTYGILDIFNGRVRNFFMDGVFNPDGQLKDKIVPPEPIQKMSANWSLHDSNWFPDFPKSAEKAAWFYERTGGPTVDGVITMTPSVMQKLLEVTGPIEMSDYGVTVDKDNFIETVQQEVEVDYDKELNQPKKILADLAPKVLDKIFNAKNPTDMAKTLQILMENLNEKQILIYSKNYDIEKMLSNVGWSGEVLNTQKDYLSVINTNINGYKTDGVIDESISHQAEIQSDGSIIDTLTITRHHNGGNMDKDWWNKVNSDYMRVYVPKGSKLLAAEGQTREFDSPPLDYKKLGFKWDPQLRQEEDSTQIDEATGTRIYEDSGKTVFANWVYVSPQETVVMKYKYLLPFRLDMGMSENPVATYSLLAQKQSGSVGSKFSEEIDFPENVQMNWSYPDGAKKEENRIVDETDLQEDRFFGTAFTKR